MPLRTMLKNAAKWAPEYTSLRQELILNATKISVDMMIERLCRLTSMKGMPKGTCFGAEQTMKYVLWWARRYFKDTEQAIERDEDRLNLYKWPQSGYDDDDADEAVMLVSCIIYIFSHPLKSVSSSLFCFWALHV
jgi:hypothetical protein